MVIRTVPAVNFSTGAALQSGLRCVVLVCCACSQSRHEKLTAVRKCECVFVCVCSRIAFYVSLVWDQALVSALLFAAGALGGRNCSQVPLDFKLKSNYMW